MTAFIAYYRVSTDRQRARGFTLIELSIVLVIIGLIVGGVLVGQDLISSAQLRSVITDVEKFNTAVNTFRGKYDCLPGDCANASTLLGVPLDSSNCFSGNPLNAGTTCNGNGDGIIVQRNGNDLVAGSGPHAEALLAWQHLALAGLIPGSYSGYAPGGSVSAWQLTSVAQITSPASRVSNACYDIAYGWPDWAGEAFGAFPNTLSGHFVEFGSPIQLWNAGNAGTCHEQAITQAQAYRIDSKIDDGLPLSGSVVSNLPENCIYSPSGGWTPTTTFYDTAVNTIACGLAFRAQGF